MGLGERQGLSPGTTTFTYGYDAMDRPVSLSDSNGAYVGRECAVRLCAGRLDSMDYFARVITARFHALHAGDDVVQL